MRNFARINNHYNRIEARKDYLRACESAGVSPVDGYEALSWRKLDKLTKDLKHNIATKGATDEHPE